ncbi:hypothetical protein [Pseudomonas sp. KNUC1026]|uniref:hypothetical protein n=1 Tax=Pseudomonas sp. KNUC1026 TaxID=2893890 RepID=UPI001F3D7AA1|nr:hypothetical protein [Pseudomonas sp. KNUC1026]UFH48592.1 hypothetical protein LN139_16130 [Pseudomonas sp. KNUC1026]
MPSYVKIDASDTRHETLQKGFNLRWPGPGMGADCIYVCSTAEQVHEAANDALSEGCRITVRCGASLLRRAGRQQTAGRGGYRLRPSSILA